MTIADLAEWCGTKIPANRFNGRWRAKSSLNWPRQPPPTPQMWDVFRRAIKRIFCKKCLNYPKRLDISLDHPLGAWLQTERNVMSQWYRTSETLFERVKCDGEELIARYTQQNENNDFTHDGYRQTLPPEAHPIDILKKNGKIHPQQNYHRDVPTI